MESVLAYVMGGVVAAVILVLFAGILSFAFGNRVDRAWATRLMTLRVVLQGVAVLLLGLMVLFSAR